MCINYAKLYVTATEFFENEHDIQIDQETVSELKARILDLNSQSTSFTSGQIEEIKNILLIILLYDRNDVWDDCNFCDEIVQIQNSL